MCQAVGDGRRRGSCVVRLLCCTLARWRACVTATGTRARRSGITPPATGGRGAGGGLAQREGCGEGGCFDTTTESGRVPLGLERAAALRAYLDGERIRLMRSVEVPGGGALSPGKLPPLAVTAQLSDSFSQAAEGDGVTQSSSKMSETAAKYQVSPVRPLRARGTRSRSPRLSSLPPLARVASLPLCCHADGGIERVLIRWPLLSPALSSSLPAGRCVAGNITPREPFGSARPLQGHG